MTDAPAVRAPRPRGRPSAGVRAAIVAAALALIEEQGLGRLTTKAVAERAGAAEASVYYHFKDKVGLVQAVIEHGLSPVTALADDAFEKLADVSLDAALEQVATVFEGFFTRVMPVFSAIMSDGELRVAFGDRMAATDWGPHRGVAVVSAFLKRRQAAGDLDPDADADGIALLVIGSAFLRAFTRASARKLPGARRTMADLARLLSPAVPA